MPGLKRCTAEDMRSVSFVQSGAVVGTDDAENYFHSVAQDGNYTVYDYRYQYHNAGNDVFTVTDASSISAPNTWGIRLSTTARERYARKRVCCAGHRPPIPTGSRHRV